MPKTAAEMSKALGVSEKQAEFMLQQAEETERKLNEGFQRMAIAEPWRRYRLNYLRPRCSVTPHPAVGKTEGNWRLREFVVSPQNERTERMRAALGADGSRFCTAGVYTKLERWDFKVPWYGGDKAKKDKVWTVVMSDTDDELLDMWELYGMIFHEGVERVIINGLGLGCAVKLALASKKVKHVDVVEFSEDVINLTAPLFEGDRRLEIHHGDAYTFQFPRGTRWDVAWHDIWDEISTDNDFTTLHRRYGNRVRWQASWARQAAIEADKRQQREWQEFLRLQEEFNEGD